jgi:hypothetical protein
LSCERAAAVSVADRLCPDARCAGDQPAHPGRRAVLAVRRRRLGRVSRRRRGDLRAHARASRRRSRVEALHRQSHRTRAGDGRADLLRGPEQSAVSGRQPYQSDAAPVPPVQRGAQQDRQRGRGPDRRPDTLRGTQPHRRSQGLGRISQARDLRTRRPQRFRGVLLGTGAPCSARGVSAWRNICAGADGVTRVALERGGRRSAQNLVSDSCRAAISVRPPAGSRTIFIGSTGRPW